jgi:hypothetical protein
VIVHAIQQGEAIAVSDGSFKDTCGTAAWVIEGESSDGRLLGKAIAPGGSCDQSPYRSELAGIAATIFFINKLCEH